MVSVVVISLSFGLQQVHADDANGIFIQNISVQPYSVKVGDSFTVTATLVNNSPTPIVIESGTCTPTDTKIPLFTIVLDNHTTIKSKNLNCAGVGLMRILNSGEKLTGTSPDSTFSYIATKSGTANVTVTFQYGVKNQTDSAQPNIEHVISKSLLFVISDNNTGISIPHHGGPPIPSLSTPLQQFRSGIAANDVKCGQGFQLVIKSEDNSPACVKLQTAQKLVERGWGWAMQPIDSLKPLLPNRIAGLENDTGIVTFGNRTYYFETPHYTQDAYVNPVHISFHDVVFTLFPPGFKGGLPTNFGGVAANGCSGSYFWTDAKFVDGTHAFLNIFALTTMSQQCLALPAPTYFSINTDPLAGLTFYDGKMKLLVSVEGKLQQNNPVFSATIPTNETIYHDFPQPRGYSIINSTQGIIVNTDAEASNLTGFSVKSPTYLPQGYKVKLIKASKEIPMVTIFVSKYPLTDNITSHDFLWNQQGILITYQQVAPHELEHFNQLFYGPEDKIIRINGALAVISDISKQYYHGYPYDMWGSLLAIQNNDTNIAIDGFLNSDDFIKIATSMLEK